MKKSIKALIVILAILVCLGGLCLVYFFGATYTAYSPIAKIEFKIPGLNDSLCPQGMCYVEDENLWLVSGYSCKNDEKSKIYVVDDKSGEVIKYFTIQSQNEKFESAHFCGVAQYDDVVWIATDGYLLLLSFDDVLSVANAGEVEVLSEFDTKTGADFIQIYDGKLYVGDFYRQGYSKENATHKVKVSNQQTNYALMLEFPINLNLENKIETTPTLAISIPNQVQGFVFGENGAAIFSTSYSLPDSKFYVYEKMSSLEDNATISLSFGDIPLKVYSNEDLNQILEGPCMSEALCLKGDRVYILYESACDKYKLFTRTRTNVVHSIKLTDFFVEEK